MNIFDIVTANNVKDIYEENTKDKPPFIGEAFFPATKQLGLKFSLIKGKEGSPVALVPSAFDVKVLFRDAEGIEVSEGKLPFFKEGVYINEELRQQINTYRDEYGDQLITQVFKEPVGLLDGAEVSVEAMRMGLLSEGTFAINCNGVNKSYDYGFDRSKQFKTESTLWSASGAKPYASFVKQLRAYKKQTLKEPGIVIMSDTLFDKLALDEDVLNVFNKLSTPVPFPSPEQVRTYIEGANGITILITDEVYRVARDFGGSDVRYYPEDRYTILPNMILGETIYGTTPEESDLLSSNSKASSVAVTSKGVAITTWEEVDPVNVLTKVSQVVAPSCPQIDKIYIVKVL